eukprot:1188753-Prorocentrum_minimum.AAC.2
MVCRTITGYQRQRCSRFPEARGVEWVLRGIWPARVGDAGFLSEHLGRRRGSTSLRGVGGVFRAAAFRLSDGGPAPPVLGCHGADDRRRSGATRVTAGGAQVSSICVTALQTCYHQPSSTKQYEAVRTPPGAERVLYYFSQCREHRRDAGAWHGGGAAVGARVAADATGRQTDVGPEWLQHARAPQPAHAPPAPG